MRMALCAYHRKASIGLVLIAAAFSPTGYLLLRVLRMEFQNGLIIVRTKHDLTVLRGQAWSYII